MFETYKLLEETLYHRGLFAAEVLHIVVQLLTDLNLRVLLDSVVENCGLCIVKYIMCEGKKHLLLS